MSRLTLSKNYANAPAAATFRNLGRFLPQIRYFPPIRERAVEAMLALSSNNGRVEMKPSIAVMSLLAFSAATYAADTSVHRYVIKKTTPPSTQGKATANDAAGGV